MRDRDSLEGGLMMNKLPHTLPPVMILMTGTPWKRGIKFLKPVFCCLIFQRHRLVNESQYFEIADSRGTYLTCWVVVLPLEGFGERTGYKSPGVFSVHCACAVCTVKCCARRRRKTAANEEPLLLPLATWSYHYH